MAGGFRRVFDFQELVEGSARSIEVDGVRLCVARVGDAVYAVPDCCTHAEYPLSDGPVDADGRIECVLHGAVFDLTDGRVVEGPATERLCVYPTKVVEGEVWVRVE